MRSYRNKRLEVVEKMRLSGEYALRQAVLELRS